MLLYVIRALFIVLIAAFLFFSINFPYRDTAKIQDVETLISIAKTMEVQGKTEEAMRNYRQAAELKSQESIHGEEVFYIFAGGIGIAILVIAADWLTPKKSLNALAGVFFGLLIGLLISWAVSFILEMLTDIYLRDTISTEALQIFKWITGLCICYLVISVVIQTKDDIRFLIPYVEFSRQTKGLRPLVLDTSVIIDGRISDIAQTKLFDAPLIVPRFVLNELQLIADSSDKMKRNRGRRGLDMLNKLQNSSIVDVKIDDTPPPGVEERTEVDQKLVAFTKVTDGRLVTNDYNLNKVASLRGVDVININDMANALKTVVLPGEKMQIKIMRPGEEQTQGIGYLDDGTMVVVEDARSYIGKTIGITVTSSLQTSAGRMIFGKAGNDNSGGSGGSSSQDNKNDSKNYKRYGKS